MAHQQRCVIYCRVSTEDQSCERQERDLIAYAQRADYQVVHVFKESASGGDNDRRLRRGVMDLCQKREVDIVLVTELTRWGRSTPDLISTVEKLASWNVSLMCQTGMTFNINTPEGKLMLTIFAALSQFERDINHERTKSGLANARAKGKKLGRQDGDCPVQEKYSKKILKLREEGRSIRWIAHELQISPMTVQRALK